MWRKRVPGTLGNRGKDWFLEEYNEIVIPCWPYSGTADGIAGRSSEHAVSRVKSVVSIYAIIWIVLFLFIVVHTFNYGLLQFIKYGIIGLIPLLAMTRGTTHIRCDVHGLRFESNSPGASRRGREIPWHSVKEIFLIKPRGRDPLHYTLCFKQNGGRTTKLKLSKIATSENWRKLLSAIDAWSPVKPQNLDDTLLDSLTADRKDPTFTALWLEALSAPPHRERLAPLSEGSTLNEGTYTLVRRLGAGGQGTAYLASTVDGASVVLKEYILPVYVDVKARRRAVERFQHEAMMLKKLDHPLVVKLLDSFVDDHRAYLVLEFIDGPSLKALVEGKGRLSNVTAARYGLMMCDILTYLHTLAPPIVHRDFTPDNLILSKDGSLKLIDFMIAQQSEDSATATVVGKHCYLPPEQFKGKANTQSDIYALGGTLFFLLTGQDPEPITCLHPIITCDAVSGLLDEIVAKCTELALEKRYLSASEIRRDLVRFLSHEDEPSIVPL